MPEMLLVWFMIIMAVMVGGMMPLQAGVNAQLAKQLEHPVFAAIISFVGGLLAMLLVFLLSRNASPPMDKLPRVPFYLFTGGLLGAIIVITSILLAYRLGATVLISCLIAGQLLASLILDHYGWVGFAVHPVNAFRIAGVAFLFVGVVLVRFF